MLDRRLTPFLMLLMVTSLNCISMSTLSPLDRPTTRNVTEDEGHASNGTTATNTVTTASTLINASSETTPKTAPVMAAEESPAAVVNTDQSGSSGRSKKKLYSALTMEERIARDDWRAPIAHPVVIWSRESKWHPDFGEDDGGVGGLNDR